MTSMIEKLRGELLVGALDGALPLTMVDSCVNGYMPEATDRDVQAGTLEIIRSLANEGLVALGDLSNETGHLIAWSGSVEESMERISGSYVAEYDDEDAWIWSAWLELTEKGKLVAQRLRQSSTISDI